MLYSSERNPAVLSKKLAGRFRDLIGWLFFHEHFLYRNLHVLPTEFDTRNLCTYVSRLCVISLRAVNKVFICFHMIFVEKSSCMFDCDVRLQQPHNVCTWPTYLCFAFVICFVCGYFVILFYFVLLFFIFTAISTECRSVIVILLH